jgi:hypothetical protein
VLEKPTYSRDLLMALLAWILNQQLEFNLQQKPLTYKTKPLKTKYGILQDNKDLELSQMRTIGVL